MQPLDSLHSGGLTHSAGYSEFCLKSNDRSSELSKQKRAKRYPGSIIAIIVKEKHFCVFCIPANIVLVV